MLVREALCVCLFHVVLPLILLVAGILRYNAFSIIYIILLLLAPLIPSSLAFTKGYTGCYLKCVIGISALFCIFQVIFQVVLISLGSYGSFINYCKWDGYLFGLIGLNRLDQLDLLHAIRLIGLDLLVLLLSIFILIICKCLERGKYQNTLKIRQTSGLSFILNEILTLVFMITTASLQPSVISFVYFLSFFAICTLLAWNLNLLFQYKYTIFKVPLFIYCGIHFIILYIYQFNILQQFIHHQSFYARLFGLIRYIDLNCNNVRILQYLNLNWSTLIHPLALICLYFTLVTTFRIRILNPMFLRNECIENSRNSKQVSDQHKSFDNTREDISIVNLEVHSNNETNENTQTIKTEKRVHEKTVLFANFFCKFIFKRSYVATIIIMM
ncbi:piezo-type mechanosensitive ion channel component 2-like, partial [Centruroides sculpturatus]|uniref:piezo-type mechanosensitive ion channel component 2-like n=1 Tax=Centruroides sculpturatus TaxID=218467 RepID=UPI000C6E2409